MHTCTHKHAHTLGCLTINSSNYIYAAPGHAPAIHLVCRLKPTAITTIMGKTTMHGIMVIFTSMSVSATSPAAPPSFV